MSQIMIAYEKYGPRYISMEKGIGPTAQALLQERVDSGEWYDAIHDAPNLASARRALDGSDPKLTPWHFLNQRSRSRYEFEGVEIVDLEDIAK